MLTEFSSELICAICSRGVKSEKPTNVEKDDSPVSGLGDGRTGDDALDRRPRQRAHRAAIRRRKWNHARRHLEKCGDLGEGPRPHAAAAVNQPRVRIGAIEEHVVALHHQGNASGMRTPADNRVAPKLPQPVRRVVDRAERVFVLNHRAMMQRQGEEGVSGVIGRLVLGAVVVLEMDRAKRAAIVVLGVLAWPGGAGAQSDALLEAYDRSKGLFAEGRFADAIPFAAEAVAHGEAEFGGDDITTAMLLNNLAELHRAAKDYAAAEPLHRRALEILGSRLPPEDTQIAVSAHNLAEVYRAQERYAEAETLHLQALEIRRLAFGPGDPAVALSLDKLAALYHAQGRDDAAEPLYVEALAIAEETLGEDHPFVAATLGALARLYAAQRRNREAENFYQRAVTAWDAARGGEGADLAAALEDYAALLREAGRSAGAEALDARARGIRAAAPP
jgi:hypothetical protein